MLFHINTFSVNEKNRVSNFGYKKLKRIWAINQIIFELMLKILDLSNKSVCKLLSLCYKIYSFNSFLAVKCK